jgi:hypothetical protein
MAMNFRMIFLAGIAILAVPVYFLLQNYQDSHAITSIGNGTTIFIALAISAAVAGIVAMLVTRAGRPRPQ